MNLTYGYTGKILRVNLSTGMISQTDTSRYLPDYPGGKAMSAKIYWDEIPAGVKPFDPENKLIFTTSPLNGTGAAGATKCEMTTKAPGYWPGASFISTNASMLAPHLKRAGFDGLIIEGKADSPVYIDIANGNASIQKADGFWGMTTFEARKAIQDIVGQDALVACIGPAGENRNIYAAIMVDQCSCFARGGVGAVMGSKNLKAFSVRGSGRIQVAEPRALIEENIKRSSLFSIKFGEERTVHGKKIVGAPIKPWLGPGTNGPREGSRMSDDAKAGRLSFKPGGCDGCVMHCRTRYKFHEADLPEGTLKCASNATWVTEDDRDGSDPFTGHRQDPSAKSYKVAMLFDSLGLDNFVFPFRYPLRGYTGSLTPEANYGSSFSYGDFLYQAFLAGILTEENSGIPWSKTATLEFWEKLLHMITYREGFGDVLAEGPGYAAEYIKSHEQFGPDRDKIDFFYHRMNPKKGRLRNVEMGHGVYSPNPLRMLYSAVGDQQGQEPEPFWDGYGAIPIPDNVIEHYLGPGAVRIKDHSYWGPEIARAAINHEDLAGIVDIYGICCFMELGHMSSPAGYMPWKASGGSTPELVEWEKAFIENSDSGVPELLSCVSGTKVTQDELMVISERANNLIRAIWVRDGYTQDGNQDLYWDEVHMMKDDSGRTLNPKDDFLRTLHQYYEMRGWKDGVPTRAKLESLNMGYVADELEQMGLLTA